MNLREQFDLSEDRGYLPAEDPARRFGAGPFFKYPHSDNIHAACYLLLEDSKNIPKLLVAGQFRNFVDNFDSNRYLGIAGVGTGKASGDVDSEVRLVMNLLSFMAHAYLWGGDTPATVLPQVIAVPWHAVAKKVGRPPIQSYVSYAIDNWYRIDKSQGITLDNIALIQNFLAGVDEEWFTMIHVVMEAQAGPALAGAYDACVAANEQDWETVRKCLFKIAASLGQLYQTFCRMEEKCDPYIYYNRVRPYIFGTLNNPNLPDGLIYEGVEEYRETPQKFRGETGAQSAIIPALDGALGIYHEGKIGKKEKEEDVLKTYLMEMREYMPPKHRAFIEWCEENSNLRKHLKNKKDSAMELPYNLCIEWMEAFRTKHMEFAVKYIVKQGQTASAVGHGGSTLYGTGGTPFMKYLKKHRDETAEHKVIK